MQSLLDEFQGQNVDTAAWLVEGAGRFLYLLPETSQRMGNMLEVNQATHPPFPVRQAVVVQFEESSAHDCRATAAFTDLLITVRGVVQRKWLLPHFRQLSSLVLEHSDARLLSKC